MSQIPYLQRKTLYPKTNVIDTIVYYPQTVYLSQHDGFCDGCADKSVRVDSLYHFELCDKCEADDVARGIADHVFEVTTPEDGDEIKKYLDDNNLPPHDGIESTIF